MNDHESAPLSLEESRALAAIAQDLTRTDPTMLRQFTAPARPRHRMTDAREAGVYVFSVAVLSGLVAGTLGATPALIAAGILLTAGAVRVTLDLRRRPASHSGLDQHRRR